jgi:pimeloyl-ACP methyl ester carboxylesterase
MDALHLDAAVVAGHSASGLVALRFGIDQPERTLGLVLIGSPMSLRNKPGLRELWNSTIAELTDPVDPDFVRDFQGSALSRAVPPPFFETLVQESLKVPARVWRAAFRGFFEDDLSGELGKIKAPTLVIWGDQDGIVARGEQDALTGAIADSRLIVYPGVGHSPNWEDPSRLASDLVEFAVGLVHERAP